MILLTRLWVTIQKSCGSDSGGCLRTGTSPVSLSWGEAALTRGRGNNEVIRPAAWKELKWIIWSSPLPLGRTSLEPDRWESLLFSRYRGRDSSAFIGYYQTGSQSSPPESSFFWLITIPPVTIQSLVGRLLAYFGSCAPLSRNDPVPCLLMGRHQLPREGKAWI